MNLEYFGADYYIEAREHGKLERMGEAKHIIGGEKQFIFEPGFDKDGLEELERQDQPEGTTHFITMKMSIKAFLQFILSQSDVITESMRGGDK